MKQKKKGFKVNRALSVLLAVFMLCTTLFSMVSLAGGPLTFDEGGYRYYIGSATAGKMPDFSQTGLNQQFRDSEDIVHAGNLIKISRQLNSEKILYSTDSEDLENVWWIGSGADENDRISYNSITDSYYYVIKFEKLVTSVEINSPTLNIYIGATSYLYASVEPWNATDSSLTWRSEDTSIATVDEYGMVTGMGVGTTNIRATSNDGSGVYAECQVTVTDPTIHVTGVSFFQSSIDVRVGETYPLSNYVSVSPMEATDRSLTWSSEDTSIATVDGNGTVTGVGVGTTNIRATSNDNNQAYAECEVTVQCAEHEYSYTKNGTSITEKCSLCGQETRWTLTLSGEYAYGSMFLECYSTEGSDDLTYPSVNFYDSEGQGILDQLDVGTYTVKMTVGEGEKAVSVESEITITQYDINNVTIADIDDQAFAGDGVAVEPTINVFSMYVGQLTLDKDYTVTYEKNTSIGEATAHIEGIGNYTGTVDKKFNIVATAEKAEKAEEKIDAIGEVVYSDICGEKIAAARAAYEALSNGEKDKVTKLQTLEDAEATYSTLKAEDEAAEAGKKTLTADFSGVEIGYGESQTVNNITVSMGSANASEHAHFGGTVWTVGGSSEGSYLGWTITCDDGMLISKIVIECDENRARYVTGEGWVENHKNVTWRGSATSVTGGGMLTNVTNVTVFYEMSAEAVITKINKIGEVAYTDECKALIDAARAAYEELAEKKQSDVSNYLTLTDAEAKYKELKAAAEKKAAEDKKAADAAIEKIKAIGTVAYTDECEDKIEAARDAYDALSEDQQAYVTTEQLKVLTDAEKEFKALGEKAAETDAIIQKTDAIAGLEKAFVYVGGMEEGETFFVVISKGGKDVAETDATITKEGWAEIDIADTALLAEDVEYVAGLYKMTTASKSALVYELKFNATAAAEVEAVEAAIGADEFGVEVTGVADGHEYNLAVEKDGEPVGYNEGSFDEDGTVKVYLSSGETLEKGVEYTVILSVYYAGSGSKTMEAGRFNFTLTDVDEVEALIKAIGDVEYTDECKDRIDAARAAYNGLDAEDKKLVDEDLADALEEAEKEYAALEKEADDEAAAGAVIEKIKAIGTVEYTDACKAKIDAARKAYDALTEDQQGLIVMETYKILTDAEKKYEELKPVEHKIIDGKDAKWESDSKEPLKFRGDGELKDFVEVKVDGQTVAKENYTLSEGSTIVEFKDEYLATLSAGEHKLMMVWTDGTAEAEFTIEKAGDEPKKDDPKDDDPSKDEPKKDDPKDDDPSKDDPSKDEPKKDEPTKGDSKQDDSKTPKLGDENNSVLWILMAIAALGAAAVAGVCLKKKSRR